MSSNPTYGDCVSCLRTSLSFLESSVQTLDQGVQDFPRITNLLKTVRHYELIPQPTLQAAESSLRDEIGPFISLLLDRADKNLERQGRRIETLKARSELNNGRLDSYRRGRGDDDDDDEKQVGRGGGSLGREKRGTGLNGNGNGSKGEKKLDAQQALRLQVMKQRKEALKYSVERLEMEVRERERELRGRLERGG